MVALTCLLALVAGSVHAPVAGGAARLTPAQAEALVREISAKVEQLRGLKFKKPVAVRIITGAEFRERVKAGISPEAAQEALHTQNAYIQLGLVPPGTDLVKSELELAETGISGFYEHGSGTFHVLDHVTADEVRGVMAHELTHALEDQHYDLGALRRTAGGENDRAVAITALVEGSAMAVMLAFLNRDVGREKARTEVEKSQSQRIERLKVAASFTQRSLLLPYLLGFTFLLRGKPWEWAEGGAGVQISDIDAAYAQPPSATREILHPEQYWGGARLPPRRVVLKDLSSSLGPGWTRATQGSLGELGLAVLTGSKEPIELPWALLPSRWTNPAAVGAVDDAYHHYVNGSRRVTVLLTRWEAPRDAEEFEQALTQKGKHFFRYGVNLLVIAGDLEERAADVAAAAFQGLNYWKE